MNRTVFIFTVFLIMGLSGFKNTGIRTIQDFSLPNANGDSVNTNKLHKAKGLIVIFTCNHCPFARLYTKRMNELNTRFSAQKVPLIAINSMDTVLYEDETFAMMKAKASSDSFNFPYLQDSEQRVGRKFNAKHTPMAFIIWKEQNGWSIRYQGAIDDNGEHPELANSYISTAVNELLQNKKVSVSETQSFGCRIFYRK